MNKRARPGTESKGVSRVGIWRVVCSSNGREVTGEMGAHRGPCEQPQARCMLLKKHGLRVS
jgi:hypothetical protein